MKCLPKICVLGNSNNLPLRLAFSLFSSTDCDVILFSTKDKLRDKPLIQSYVRSARDSSQQCTFKSFVVNTDVKISSLRRNGLGASLPFNVIECVSTADVLILSGEYLLLAKFLRHVNQVIIAIPIGFEMNYFIKMQQAGASEVSFFKSCFESLDFFSVRADGSPVINYLLKTLELPRSRFLYSNSLAIPFNLTHLLLDNNKSIISRFSSQLPDKYIFYATRLTAPKKDLSDLSGCDYKGSDIAISALKTISSMLEKRNIKVLLPIRDSYAASVLQDLRALNPHVFLGIKELGYVQFLAAISKSIGAIETVNTMINMGALDVMACFKPIISSFGFNELNNMGTRTDPPPEALNDMIFDSKSVNSEALAAQITSLIDANIDSCSRQESNEFKEHYKVAVSSWNRISTESEVVSPLLKNIKIFAPNS